MNTPSKEAMAAANKVYERDCGKIGPMVHRNQHTEEHTLAHLIDAEFAGMRKENEKMKGALILISLMTQSRYQVYDAAAMAESALAQASEKKA